MTQRRFMIIFISLLASLWLFGCEKPQEKTATAATMDAGAVATQQQEKQVNVEVRQVTPETLVETLLVSGETMADRDVTLAAEVGGRVERLTVDLGDRVKKGQLLARIDFAMVSAQAMQAEAAQELAQKTYERLQTLRNEELISQQQIDEAASNKTQAEAAYRIAQTRLNQSSVRASIDGIVARKFVEEGEYVGPGSPVFQIVDYRTIVVKAQLPEKQIALVSRDSKVRIRIDALKKEYDAQMYVVLPAADPVSRTFQARVKVANPDFEIRVGMAAIMMIDIGEHKDVIVAPQEVVIEEESSRSVFVAENGIAHKRPVHLGAVKDNRVVISDGIKSGEQLIVVGQRDLVDGQPIRVIEN